MTDVEKYGLFAVVFVGGLLLVIATQGGFGGSEVVAVGPELIDSATPLRAPAPGTGQDASKVQVVSVLPSAPFRWEEPPVNYPGPRSIQPPARAATGTKSEPAPGTPQAAPGTHVVAAGETLSDIAKLHYGSSQRWKDLLVLNPGVDPKKLQLGQVLRVAGPPPAPATASVPKPAAEAAPRQASRQPASAARTHTVAKGDTLGEIAQRYLGSAQKADDIYRANTDVLKSKNDLKIGQVLRIP